MSLLAVLGHFCGYLSMLVYWKFDLLAICFGFRRDTEDIQSTFHGNSRNNCCYGNSSLLPRQRSGMDTALERYIQDIAIVDSPGRVKKPGVVNSALPET